MKNSMIVFFFFSFSSCFAQETKEIEGKIAVPAQEDAEGIAIYNLSTGEGTISNAEGEFTISAAQNDTLLLSALQFKELKVVIDEEIFEKGEIYVQIFLNTNQLPEVLVTSTGLTGNIKTDIETIPITAVPTFTPAELNLYFEDDAQSKVSNAAMDGPSELHGLNIIALAGAAVNLIAGIFPRKNEPRPVPVIKNKVNYLRNLYEKEFFTQSLKIEEERISEFLYFVENEGLDNRLFLPGKELDLIAALLEKAKDFRILSSEEIAVPQEIKN